MQSSVMAFFPNIAATKLDLQSMYRKYINMFGTPSNDSIDGCHITGKMSHLPVLLIDRTLFSSGTAIRSVATSYGALILR
jgi:MFS transporter, SP family, sugar:H+ symporter